MASLSPRLEYYCFEHNLSMKDKHALESLGNKKPSVFHTRFLVVVLN